MDTIQVIIADASLLSRLGLINLLNRMRFRFTYKEILLPDKLLHAIPRDHKCLLIISSNFLISSTPAFIQALRHALHSSGLILINDNPSAELPRIGFKEVIDREDSEKTILRKLDKQVLALTRNMQEMPSEEISEREKDVLRLVALGFTNKEIADRLFISSHTVITHRKNITSKIGIKTIAGLTVYAIINRLIVPEEIKQY